MKLKIKWLWLFLLLAFIGLLNFGVLVANDLADGNEAHWLNYLVDEFSGALLMLPLLPFLFWFFKKYPLNRTNLSSRLPLYLIALLLYGASHTLLMFSFRIPVYHWLGLGDYTELYGVFGYRMMMEYFKQIAVFCIIYMTYTLFKNMRERQQEKIRTAELEKRLTKARLQSLQMQLNPHFLFNTLNSISSIMHDSLDAADKMMATLSDMLRMTLKIKTEEHTVEEELSLLGRYLEIMEIRFGEKLDIKINTEKKAQKALVPVFLLQPLVENSIKYGTEKKGKTEIKINIETGENNLLLQVEDNGPGIQNKPRNGIGLNNTLERLEKLFGKKQKFSLKNKVEGGLCTKLEIPLHY